MSNMQNILTTTDKTKWLQTDKKMSRMSNMQNTLTTPDNKKQLQTEQKNEQI